MRVYTLKKKLLSIRVIELGLVCVAALLVLFVGWYTWHNQRALSSLYASNTQISAQGAAVAQNLKPSGLGVTYEGVFNDCATHSTNWCTVFESKYQFGVSYPSGWSSSVTPVDLSACLDFCDTPGRELYDIDLTPTGRQIWYASVAVYRGNLNTFADYLKASYTDKEGRYTVTVTDLEIQGYPAVRIDFGMTPPFLGSSPTQLTPVSEYLIAVKGYIYRYSYVLRKDTTELSAKESQAIFSSLQLPKDTSSK